MVEPAYGTPRKVLTHPGTSRSRGLFQPGHAELEL